MYNPERFIKHNKSKLKQCCKTAEISEAVIKELKEVKVALESQFLKEAKQIFKKYDVNTENVIFLVEYFNITDIELYDEWLHKSIS